MAVKETNQINAEKRRRFLLYLHIVPFCFWAFDVTTTLYAIDILGVAAEMNPLGWPVGAFGPLIFYIPALLFTYLLLFRIRNRLSFSAAILITALALGLGFMNFCAGVNNIGLVRMFNGIPEPLYAYVFFSNIIVQIFFWSILLTLIILAIRDVALGTAHRT